LAVLVKKEMQRYNKKLRMNSPKPLKKNAREPHAPKGKVKEPQAPKGDVRLVLFVTTIHITYREHISV